MARYGAGAAPCTLPSANILAALAAASPEGVWGKGPPRIGGVPGGVAPRGLTLPVSTRAAQRSDSARKSAGENSASAIPSEKACAPSSMRFWLSGFSTMILSAWAGPIRCGSRYVPPQPGSSPRKHSGIPAAVTPEEIVRYEQCSASSRPPPRAAPFTNANDGTPSSPNRRNTACPSRAMASASSRAATSGAPLRSAPTAKMNGLPVTPTATIRCSPASGVARAATASSASRNASSPAGPNVFGRV